MLARVTLCASTAASPPSSAVVTVLEQAIGTWCAVSGETPDLLARSGGKALSVDEIPAHEFAVPKYELKED